MKRLLSIVLVISISLSILVISIELNAYYQSYFMDSYEKNNIAEVTGKTMEELSLITEDIILYLKGKGGDELLAPHFNEKEVLHMRDVQDLFDFARIIKYICLAIFISILVTFINKKEYLYMGRSLFNGPLFIYSLLILIGILASIDFNKYFTYFHHIFFTNDLWLLNPDTDLMIQMLPESFFSGMAFGIMLSFLIIMSILQIIGLLFKRKGMGNGENNREAKKNILGK